MLCDGGRRSDDGRRGTLHVVELLLEHAHLPSDVADVVAQVVENLVEHLALVLKRVFTARLADDGQLRAFAVLRDEARQNLGRDGALGAEHGDLLGDVLQLAHVAGPLVAHEHLLGLVGEHHAVHLVFLGHLHGKEAEQQHDVLAALAQGRHLDGYRVQAVVEVLAESPLADSLADVDVGGGHDAHVGLLHLSGAHGDILARLQDAQQPGLRGQRQLAHLVEKQRPLVGHAEVARRVVDGPRVGTLHVAEQLGVDGALGNGAAVDGEVLLAAARRIVVNDAGDDLLAHAALADDEHAQVGRRHLEGDVEHMVQRIAVAHDVVPLFDAL